MYYFITNPAGASGNAGKIWKKIETYLIEKNIPFKLLLTEYAGHAGKLAEEVSLLEEDDVRLVIVGGDGTINEVLNGIKNFERIKFGVIPIGSGNDFARGNGIPNKNWKKALEKILNSDGNKKIDIGQVLIEGERIRKFGISCGIGLDAIVCKKTITSKLKKFLNAIHLGSLTYVLLTIQTLFSMEKYDVTIQFDEEEELHIPDLIYLCGMNSPFEGGGVPMAPFAKTDDGELSFCGVSGIPKFITFLVLPVLCLGKHKIFKAFKLRNYKKLKVSAQKPMVLHTDGEYAGDISHFEMEVLPAKLNLLA